MLEGDFAVLSDRMPPASKGIFPSLPLAAS